MPTEKATFRMDFEQEVISMDEKTGVVKSQLVPNPDRYKYTRTDDGQEGYLDKFDKVFIPMELIKKLASQIKGQPIYYSQPSIKNGNEYVITRRAELEKTRLNNTPFEYKDVSEDFLERLKQEKMQFVILSIDLKGSTTMSQALTPESYSKLISFFSREMTLIVSKFNGYVLKNTGDGLIAYFPEPNFIGMNDNAIDCAITMKKMIIFGLNPILNKQKLPALSFRIGLDSGEAVVSTLGAENIKMQKDLIGETINIAAKIQSCAGENQILLGESTTVHLHTFWRKIIKRFKEPDNWTYKDKKTGQTYPLYQLPENW